MAKDGEQNIPDVPGLAGTSADRVETSDSATSSASAPNAFASAETQVRKGYTPASATKTYAGMTRRTLCLGVGGVAALFGLGALKFVGTTPICRPPGGQDEEHLIGACVRCEKCYEVCPRHVIVPAHLEQGVLNMRTPTLDFSASYCDWCIEENDGYPLCVKSCPTEALKLPEKATPENTLLGIARIHEDWCLAYKLIGCRYCFDACDYEAMELDKNNRPSVIADKCNGCGACESVCVSLKNGSIAQGATERAIVVVPFESTQGGAL